MREEQRAFNPRAFASAHPLPSPWHKSNEFTHVRLPVAFFSFFSHSITFTHSSRQTSPHFSTEFSCLLTRSFNRPPSDSGLPFSFLHSSPLLLKSGLKKGKEKRPRARRRPVFHATQHPRHTSGCCRDTL